MFSLAFLLAAEAGAAGGELSCEGFRSASCACVFLRFSWPGGETAFLTCAQLSHRIGGTKTQTKIIRDQRCLSINTDWLLIC